MDFMIFMVTTLQFLTPEVAVPCGSYCNVVEWHVECRSRPPGSTLAAGVDMPLHASPVARQIIGSAIEVHRVLGPGLLESAYERCLARELRGANLDVKNQVEIPVVYKGDAIDCSYRADLIVANEVLVEVKSVASLSPLHLAQTLTYLKLTGLKQALVLNFNVVRLKDGIRSLLR